MIKKINQTVTIKKELAVELERILEIPQFDEDFEETDSILFRQTYYFVDGTHVEICVCTGQNNAWVDSTWTDKNNQHRSSTEAMYDLLGEYTFDTPDCSYSLTLEAE